MNLTKSRVAKPKTPLDLMIFRLDFGLGFPQVDQESRKVLVCCENLTH
jgi:hypothetical protein